MIIDYNRPRWPSIDGLIAAILPATLTTAPHRGVPTEAQQGGNSMLTIWGGNQRFCDGLTRRNFLKIGAFGAGLSLAGVSRGGEPSALASNKAAIMIYLAGGPPHIDMYDLKPDAPVEYRGEFKPIKTNVPGVEICELFPRQARMWDKL